MGNSKSEKPKTLIAIRHAHRDTTHKSEDNGLDDKGWRQAKEVLNYYKDKLPDSAPRIISSPKRRCLETVELIAEYTGSAIESNYLLNEQEDESDSEFIQRIERFQDEWVDSKDHLTVICSHGDWLPTFFELLLDESIELKKSGWVQIETRDNDEFVVVDLIQDWKSRKLHDD